MKALRIGEKVRMLRIRLNKKGAPSITQGRLAKSLNQFLGEEGRWYQSKVARLEKNDRYVEQDLQDLAAYFSHAYSEKKYGKNNTVKAMILPEDIAKLTWEDLFQKLTQVTASFTYLQTEEISSYAIEFTDTSSNAYKKIWDFGDDHVKSFLANQEIGIIHHFQKAGTYPVTLTVENRDKSESDSITQDVEVQDDKAGIKRREIEGNDDDKPAKEKIELPPLSKPEANPLVKKILILLILLVLVFFIWMVSKSCDRKSPPPQQATGSITSPLKNTTVETTFRSTGNIKDMPKEGYHAWLVIERNAINPDSLKRGYWPKEPELLVNPDGTWEAEIQHNPGEDPYEKFFSLTLYLVDDTSHSKIQNWLRRGIEVGDFPAMNNIPWWRKHLSRIDSLQL